MLLKILFVAAVAFGVLAVVIASKPGEFRVTRQARISAPTEAVFTNVNNLRKWKAWSPWAKLDPGAKESFEGPEAGTGASMHWAGNNQVGEGRMTITESRLGELVRFRLEFFKPFASSSEADFSFRFDGQQTVVTWTMTGKKNFMMKAMSLVMNCDKMMGGQFEQGLTSLKAVAETVPVS